jgi:hypothetical protein
MRWLCAVAVVEVTTITPVLEPGLPAGLYQLRGAALTADLQLGGPLGDAVTVALGAAPPAMPAAG